MHARNGRKKKIAMEEKFVFTTKEVLKLVEGVGVKIVVKKACKQPRKCSIQEILKKK